MAQGVRLNRRQFIAGSAALGASCAIGMPRLEARPELVPALVEEQLVYATQWITIDQMRDMYPPAGSMVELLDEYYRPRMMTLLREAMQP